MMSYIDLPVSQVVHPARKLILRLGFVLIIISSLIYFISSVSAAVIYSNSNTYTKNGPDSSVYYTAFTTSFVPAISSSSLKNTYEVMGTNTATVKVRVYINGSLVEDSTWGSLSNNTWTAKTYPSSGYYSYTLNAGTTYNLEVKYTRGNYFSTPYSVSIRNFSIQNNISDTAGPTFTLSTGQGGFGPYTAPRENIGPIPVNYYTATVTASDVGSGISQFYACAASGNVSCYPSTQISGNSFSTQVAYNDGSGGKGVCYRAKDNSGNWTPSNGGSGEYYCTYFLRQPAAPSNVVGSTSGYGSVNVEFYDNSYEYSGGGYDERFYIYRQINGGTWDVASSAVVSPHMPPGGTSGPVSWGDYNVPASACNGTVRYKAIAIVSAAFTSPESSPSNTVNINADTGFNCPLPAPSQCSAVAYSGPTRVQVNWYDNHNGNEQFTIRRDNNDGNFNTTVASNLNGPAGTGNMSYTNNSPPATAHRYRIYVHNPGCFTCNQNYCDTNLVQAAQIAPSVTTLTANKVYTNSNVAISYTAQANGGATISRYEVWRAPRDQNGNIGTWQNITGSSYTLTSYTDTPPYNSDWLYGLHVIDNNNNCITEDGTHCGGIVSDSLDPRTPVALVIVKKDTTSPNTPTLIPPPGTYSCSATNPLVVLGWSNDTGWPQSPPAIIHYALNGTATCGTQITPPQITTSGSVSAVGCDQAGNISASTSGVYSCNTSPPAITFSSSSTPPQYGWTNGNISVPITISDGDRVSYGRYLWCPPGQQTCDPGTTAANIAPFVCNGTSSTCVATVTYTTDGAWYVCARGRDIPGNWSPSQCSGFYGRDTVLPTVTSVIGPAITNDTTPSAAVYYTDALSGWASVTVDFYDVENGHCGNASLPTNPATLTMPLSCYQGGGGEIGKTDFWKNPLAWLWEKIWQPARAQNTGGDGQYRFYIRARDAAGNYSNPYNYYVTIDTQAPSSVTINSFGYVNPNNGNSYANISNHRNITFSGSCSENGTNNLQLFMYSNNGAVIDTGKTISCSGGLWSKTGVDLLAFAQGEFFVHPILYDAAGNYISNYRQGIKDTVSPTTPTWKGSPQYSCLPNPTSQSMQVSWNAATDASGIKNYTVQSYGCSCSSSIGGSCVTPTPIGVTWSHPYDYFSSYNGDGYYAWQVGAVDNANNPGTATGISPNCFSDHTNPNPAIINTANPPTTPSPTSDITPTVGFTLSTDPPNPGGNCYSGSYCTNLQIFRPNGSSCFSACLSPETTDFTMLNDCYNNDGAYTFQFQAQDSAGNWAPYTNWPVTIDTRGPVFGTDIISNVDPRGDEKLMRNYTVTGNGTLNTSTNSNFPVLSFVCDDPLGPCNIANSNPLVYWDPSGPIGGDYYNCSELPLISDGTVYCLAIPTFSASESPAEFRIYFDNWVNNGHNGRLSVDYTQIFTDASGNPATCLNEPCQPQVVDINNLPPTINIGAGDK